MIASYEGIFWEQIKFRFFRQRAPGFERRKPWRKWRLGFEGIGAMNAYY